MLDVIAAFSRKFDTPPHNFLMPCINHNNRKFSERSDTNAIKLPKTVYREYFTVATDLLYKIEAKCLLVYQPANSKTLQFIPSLTVRSLAATSISFKVFSSGLVVRK